VLTWISLLSIYTYFMNKFTYVLKKIVMTLYGRDRNAASASMEGIGVLPQPPIYTYCRSFTLHGRVRSAASTSAEGIGVPPQPPIHIGPSALSSSSFWIRSGSWVWTRSSLLYRASSIYYGLGISCLISGVGNLSSKTTLGMIEGGWILFIVTLLSTHIFFHLAPNR
jgi:hypothetical protein